MVQQETTLTIAVESYLIDCQARRLTKKTLEYYGKSLRMLQRFVADERIVSESPLDKLRAPKLPQHEITAFTAEEIKKIFKPCECDIAVCMMLLDSGLRLSELLKLNVGDVNLATGAVKVKEGKDQKDRIVYLGAKCRRQVHRYLSKRGTQAKATQRALRGFASPCTSPHDQRHDSDDGTIK